MRHSRLAVLVFGSALAVGGVASTAFATSDDAPRTTPNTSASTPTSTPAQNPETRTTTAGGSVTLNVAGVGTVTFTVDPTTAAISDVVVTPIDGVSTGAPVATPDGVRIQVTAADGTVRVLQIKAHHEDAGLEVQTELEVNDENENEHAAENENEAHDRGDDGQNRGPVGVGNDNRGRDDGPRHDSAINPGSGVFTPSPSAPAATDDHGIDSGRDNSGSGSSGSGSGDSGGGHSGGRD
jgi:uncharacterized membrane protein YgcG